MNFLYTVKGLQEYEQQNSKTSCEARGAQCTFGVMNDICFLETVDEAEETATETDVRKVPHADLSKVAFWEGPAVLI